MKYLFLTFVLLIPKIDIMGQVFSQSKYDSLFSVGDALLSNQEYSKAVGVFNDLLKFTPDDSTILLNKICSSLGVGYTYLPNHNLARLYLDSALSLSSKDSLSYSSTLLDIGNLYYMKAELDSAMNYYLAVLDFGYRDFLNDLTALENIGNVYQRFEIDTIAISYFDRALELALEFNDSIKLARIYTDYAISYENMDYVEKSLEFSRKSIAILERMNTVQDLAVAYMNHGVTLQLVPDFDSAEYYHKLSLGLFEKSGDQFGVINSLINIAFDQDIENTDHYRKWLDEALTISDSLGLTEMKKQVHYYYAYCDSSYGDFKSAMHHFAAHYKLDKEMQIQDQVKEVEKLKTQFDFNTQEKEKILLENKNKISSLTISRQRILVFSLLIIVASLLMLAFYIFKLYQEKKSLNHSLTSKNHQIETLMRELHHRVKNNLQVISSLLGLQSSKLKDAKAQKAVEEGQERIRAMSLIHQKLYQQDDVTTVNLKEYLETLVKELSESYGYGGKAQLSVEVPSIPMDVDTTMPIGLIVNELVSNSFKYAFDDIEEPMLKLEMIQKSNGHFQFSINDNGKGLPQGFSLDQATSFGLKLVRLLVRQLGAKLEVSQENGLEYKLDFAL